MSEDNIMGTPPELRELADNSVTNLLPDKSRLAYEKQYKKFQDWCKDKKVHTISENVLLAYFEVQRKKYKSSTLWATYSMLRSCLNIHENIDISKYKKLQALLKRCSAGYIPKKSNILAMKVILIIGYNGACRREELTNMSIDDIEFKSNSIIVSVPKTKNNVPRIFAIADAQWITIIQKYANLRPMNVTSSRFFLTYRNGYCINSPIGINIMGKISKMIATFLKLPNPELYTGHCFRRSSATHLANCGGNLLTIKRHGGWKSSSVAEGYVEASLKQKIEVAHMFGSQSTNLNMPGCSRDISQGQLLEVPGINITAADTSNVTINIYNNCTTSQGNI